MIPLDLHFSRKNKEGISFEKIICEKAVEKDGNYSKMLKEIWFKF